MIKFRNILLELAAVVIITIPAFSSLLNNNYFSMHDDQHVARLYLLDQGIKQGNLFPRWVGELGFGYGYPLYNFYPPFIYYTAEVFHLMGMSYIWSIKATFILGFVIAAFGIYLYVKKITKSKLSGLVSATLYTYFFYHAVLIYVRGALAEFFSLAILPLVFLAFDNLSNRHNKTNAILFGASLAILILTHPLIAFPAIFFLGFSSVYYYLRSKNKTDFLKFVIIAGLIGLFLSAFFWLPSIVERKYTLVDKILTGELASYKLHYIYPSQFLYSPWGYGGSGLRLSDGMTFQLGKVQIVLVILSFVLSIFYLWKKNNQDINIKFYYFFLFLLLFSLVMTTELSFVIWDNLKFLWYLQFPWRFLTFTGLFISVIGGYVVLFIDKLLQQQIQPPRLKRELLGVISVVLVFSTILIYSKYFKPQRFIATTDSEKTNHQVIAWDVSSTSYEFVPKGVKTKITELGTTKLAINKENIRQSLYETIIGEAEVKTLVDKFQEKVFQVEAYRTTMFRLNTYNFPGWTAYIDGKKIAINDENDLKLITVNVPTGQHNLSFKFEDTGVRKIGNLISIASFILICFLLTYKFKKIDG